jgi:hypothetical protein
LPSTQENDDENIPRIRRSIGLGTSRLRGLCITFECIGFSGHANKNSQRDQYRHVDDNKHPTVKKHSPEKTE